MKHRQSKAFRKLLFIGLGFAHKGTSMMEMGTFFAANKAIFDT